MLFIPFKKNLNRVVGNLLGHQERGLSSTDVTLERYLLEVLEAPFRLLCLIMLVYYLSNGIPFELVLIRIILSPKLRLNRQLIEKVLLDPSPYPT